MPSIQGAVCSPAKVSSVLICVNKAEYVLYNLTLVSAGQVAFALKKGKSDEQSPQTARCARRGRTPGATSLLPSTASQARNNRAISALAWQFGIIKAMSLLIRLPWLLCATLSLTACAPLLSLVGINQTMVQTAAQVERAKVAVDGVSYVASSKTTTDHALSVALGKNCKVFNIVARDPVCTDETVADGPTSDGR